MKSIASAGAHADGRAIPPSSGHRALLRRLVAGARHHQVPLALALIRAARLYRGAQFSPREILTYALYSPAAVAQYPVLISKQRSLAKLARINPRPDQWQTEDKALFYARCDRAGLPVPQWYGVIGARGGHDAQGRPLAGRADWLDYLDRTLPDQFIVKDRGGAYGSGFAAYAREGGRFRDLRGGAAFALGELYERVTRPGADSLVLQERLFDHPWLEELAGRPGLQTLRLTTYRPAASNVAVRLLFYFLKVRVGENLADNFSSGATGNLVAIGGEEPGRLIGAMSMLPCGSGLCTTATHPETGLRFDAQPLPGWSEAIALVVRAHQEFREFGALGWDVALTARGPVLLEANAWWDPPNYAPWIMSAADWQAIFG